MKQLFTGIYNKFTSLTSGVHNDFYTAISGKMYLGIAPQNTTYPYVVYSLVTDIHSWMFREEFETCLLQFSIYSESSSPLEAENIYSDLISLFDWCNLSVSGYAHLYMRRENSNLLWDESTFTAQRSNKVFIKNVDYKIMIEKDITPPIITAFVIPATSTAFIISITTFTATDNVGVIGYLVNELASTPSITDVNWSSSVPTTYTFSSLGSKTLYAWAKDSGGNISASKNASINIIIPPITSVGMIHSLPRFVSATNSELVVSDDGSDWTIIPKTGTWYGVNNDTYSSFGRSNKFVLVGNGILTSDDGITWTPVSGITQTYKCITYANGIFVAPSYGGAKAAVSVDGGTTWIEYSCIAGNWKAITSGWFFPGGISTQMFAAVGEAGKVMTSTDGINWTERQLWTWSGGPETVLTTNLNGICWGNGQRGQYFMVVGDGGVIGLSFGGVVWKTYDNTLWVTYAIPGITKNLNAIFAATGNYGYFIYEIVGDDGTIVYTSDQFGHTFPDWHIITLSSPLDIEDWLSIGYGNDSAHTYNPYGLMVAGSSGGKLMKSLDVGTTWTEISI